MFTIYYDQNQHNLYCKSSITLKTFLLLSNLSLNTFAYNANEKVLFLIENQTQTLRMYKSINCEIPEEMQMHSWMLNQIINPIESIDIDLENRQLIFSTRYNFLKSNLSEPNVTNIVYSTNEEIKRFIYEPLFKRIFWTTNNQTHPNLFFVYTCDNQFKQCYDTSIVLPSAWPFAFFDVCI